MGQKQKNGFERSVFGGFLGPKFQTLGGSRLLFLLEKLVFVPAKIWKKKDMSSSVRSEVLEEVGRWFFSQALLDLRVKLLGVMLMQRVVVVSKCYDWFSTNRAISFHCRTIRDSCVGAAGWNYEQRWSLRLCQGCISYCTLLFLHKETPQKRAGLNRYKKIWKGHCFMLFQKATLSVIHSPDSLKNWSPREWSQISEKTAEDWKGQERFFNSSHTVDGWHPVSTHQLRLVVDPPLFTGCFC